MGFLNYWGKAGSPTDSPPQHLLAYHSLDVAACAREMLVRDRTLFGRVRAACERARLLFSDADLLSTVTFLVATHDLGKFSGRFQMLRPDIAKALGLSLPAYPYVRRHDAMGSALWRDFVLPHMLSRSTLVIETPSGPLDELDCYDFLMPWLSAVTGHHGQPPAPLDGRGETEKLIAREQVGAVLEYVDAVARLFGSMRILLCESPQNIDRALSISSWLLAGIAVSSDWIGSNRLWFPFVEEPMGLDRYWLEVAQPRAVRAIEAAGVLPVEPTPFPGFTTLFPGISEPSPLQAVAVDLPLDEGPQLLLIEDQTGAGKTEAAITLAGRLMASRGGDGFFVALPTMATANAMHGRLASVYPRLFATGSSPTFVLAHGESRQITNLEKAPAAAPYSEGEREIASDLGRWLGDSNKKALLAQIGVGTIDQVLLAALRAKHSVLRLLGLHRHVLVVDEVHACDAYVATVLETVLEFQAMLGGSVILLSATLPRRMKDRFVRAFQKGLGTPNASVPGSEEYPLVTACSAEASRTVPCGVRKGLERRVPVRFVHDASEARRQVVDLAASGSCVVWVRNTVRDALRTYDDLVAELGQERVSLFHARFLLGDRLRIEKDVLERYGKNSTSSSRAGQVLVATQVVEQSLDIDFDAMVSDLAPVDVLIQRSGRLHRHPRVGRAAPELVVLAPEWSTNPDPRHFTSLLSRTVHVYPDLGVLWRTQRTLRELGEMHVPTQSRYMIEAVYGDDSDVPDGVRSATRAAEDKAAADRGMARFFRQEPGRGYVYDTEWSAEDMGAPTRLGEPTARLRFGVVDAGVFRPCFPEWAGAWQLSTCRVPLRQVCGAMNGEQEEIVLSGTAGMPDGGRGCINFAVRAESASEWWALGVRPDGSQLRMDYDRRRGLVIGDRPAS